MKRRNFIKTSSIAGGGLLLSLQLPFSKVFAQSNATFTPHAFIKITPDNYVHVSLCNPEMGQGIHTGIPMIVAEELGADWNRLKFVKEDYAPDRRFGRQQSGGSSGIIKLWTPLRKAGATAREMLKSAAAQQWQVEAKNCKAENSYVIHPNGQKKLSFGQLASKAASISPPANPSLKPSREYTLIGQSKKSIRTQAIVTGKADYGINTKIPDMVYAASLRCPVFRGKLVNYKDDKAKAIANVLEVVTIKNAQHNYIQDQVVVIAKNTWAAFKGKAAVEAQWDNGTFGSENSNDIRKKYQKATEKEGVVSYAKGKAKEIIAQNNQKFTANYENAYQTHASMEPLSCVVKVENNRCEVWAPTQSPGWAYGRVARALKIPAKNITFHITPSGGGFGRRLIPDFVIETALVAQKVGKPVKMMWTREDDIQHGFYHPYQHHQHTMAFDAENNPVAWHYKLVSPFHTATFNPRFTKLTQKHHGSIYPPANPYELANMRNEYIMENNQLASGWWRSVDFHGWAFSIESFVDEVAHKLGKDPYEFRVELLKNPKILKLPRTSENLDQSRQLEVLKATAKRANWGKKMPKGSAQGIACCTYFHCDTYVAQAAEVSVQKDGALKIDKVVCGVDCGTVINPNLAKQQIEGGIIYGLSALLYGEITLENGRVKQSNFHDYQVARMHDTPEIEVFFMDNKGRNPGGTGEPGVPAIAPAVLNAIFKATGKRIRKMPLKDQNLTSY